MEALAVVAGAAPEEGRAARESLTCTGPGSR